MDSESKSTMFFGLASIYSIFIPAAILMVVFPEWEIERAVLISLVVDHIRYKIANQLVDLATSKFHESLMKSVQMMSDNIGSIIRIMAKQYDVPEDEPYPKP